MMVVTLVAHRKSVASTQMDSRQHAQSFEQIQGAIDGRTPDSVRPQLVDESLGRKRPRLIGDGLHDQLAPARQPQALFVQAAQHPLRAREISAALRCYCSSRHRVSPYHTF